MKVPEMVSYEISPSKSFFCRHNYPTAQINLCHDMKYNASKPGLHRAIMMKNLA